MIETLPKRNRQMVRAELRNWNNRVAIVVTGELYDMRLAGEWVDVAPGEIIPETCEIGFDAAQRLMDDLWSCGLRPTEGAGSAGALAATQKHLDDMRKLVFETLKVTG